jgi:hypothetical protein
MTGVPDPVDLLAVTDTAGENWLVLVGNRTWNQPLPAEVIALGVPRLDSWMQLHPYLVPTTRVEDLTTWARARTGSGDGCPTSPRCTTSLS